MIKCKREINGNVWNLNVILQNTNYTKSSLSQSEAPKHTAQLYLAYFLAINKAHNKNTIRDGGSIALYTAYTVYTVYTWGYTWDCGYCGAKNHHNAYKNKAEKK